MSHAVHEIQLALQYTASGRDISRRRFDRASAMFNQYTQCAPRFQRHFLFFLRCIKIFIMFYALWGPAQRSETFGMVMIWKGEK